LFAAICGVGALVRLGRSLSEQLQLELRSASAAVQSWHQNTSVVLPRGGALSELI